MDDSAIAEVYILLLGDIQFTTSHFYDRSQCKRCLFDRTVFSSRIIESHLVVIVMSRGNQNNWNTILCLAVSLSTVLSELALS
jgi:hypothetical protein